MAQRQLLYGFHAVLARLRARPEAVHELYVDAARRDPRMQDVIRIAQSKGVRVMPVETERLDGFVAKGAHQGVVARVDEFAPHRTLDEILDDLREPALLLVLDGISDPRNLGACLRVADGAGVHAVIAPKDRATGLSAVVMKAASGAAETVPYVTVTNLARTLRSLKERDIRVVGTADDVPHTLYAAQLTGPVALVLGAEGEGLRRLTRDTCDELVKIPMAGAVESLNVSVAAGVCLYEALRQRSEGARQK